MTRSGMPALLALVRHGESAWIAEGRFQGRGDPPLSELGSRQAAAVATRLARPDHAPGLPVPVERPLAIWHSPLARAAQTAAAIAEARGHDAPLLPLASLAELAQGEWEGLTHDEVRRRFPDELEAWRRDPFRHHAPGGESLSDALARARLAASTILDAPAAMLAEGVWGSRGPVDRGEGPAEPVLGYERRLGAPGGSGPGGSGPSGWSIVVAHDGILRLLMLDLMGVDPRRYWAFPFALASVTVLDLTADVVRLRAHNLDEHIVALARKPGPARRPPPSPEADAR